MDKRMSKLDDDVYEHYKYIFSQKMLGKESEDKCEKKYIDYKKMRKKDPLYLYYEKVYCSALELHLDTARKCDLCTDATTDKFIFKLIESDFKLDSFEGETYDAWKKTASASRPSRKPQIYCPYCKSTNVKKLSLTGKALSIGGLGILSNKIGKTYQCNNCKSTW